MKLKFKSEMYEGCAQGLCFVHQGVAYPVASQGAGPFNNSDGVPTSKTPKLGHITDGTYYYPPTSEVMSASNCGFSKKDWAAAGYEVHNA